VLAVVATLVSRRRRIFFSNQARKSFKVRAENIRTRSESHHLTALTRLQRGQPRCERLETKDHAKTNPLGCRQTGAAG